MAIFHPQFNDRLKWVTSENKKNSFPCVSTAILFGIKFVYFVYYYWMYIFFFFCLFLVNESSGLVNLLYLNVHTSTHTQLTHQSAAKPNDDEWWWQEQATGRCCSIDIQLNTDLKNATAMPLIDLLQWIVKRTSARDHTGILVPLTEIPIYMKYLHTYKCTRAFSVPFCSPFFSQIHIYHQLGTIRFVVLMCSLSLLILPLCLSISLTITQVHAMVLFQTYGNETKREQSHTEKEEEKLVQELYDTKWTNADVSSSLTYFMYIYLYWFSEFWINSNFNGIKIVSWIHNICSFLNYTSRCKRDRYRSIEMNKNVCLETIS